VDDAIERKSYSFQEWSARLQILEIDYSGNFQIKRQQNPIQQKWILPVSSSRPVFLLRTFALTGSK
jgi:hypothetical protein